MSATIHPIPTLIGSVDDAIKMASGLGMVAVMRGGNVLFAKALDQSELAWQLEWIGVEVKNG